jgi:hypothetical protein
MSALPIFRRDGFSSCTTRSQAAQRAQLSTAGTRNNSAVMTDLACAGDGLPPDPVMTAVTHRSNIQPGYATGAVRVPTSRYLCRICAGELDVANSPFDESATLTVSRAS